MKATVLLAALALCGSAQAADWTRLTIAEEAAFQTVHIVDWTQTLDIARRKQYTHEYCWPACGQRVTGYSRPYCEVESAWVIGREPSRANVNAYMAESALLHVAVSYALLNHPRLEQFWQLTSLGIAVGTVSHNFSIGLHARL